MTADLLVSTNWLGERLDRAGRDFVLVDAGDASAYRRAHLPGAMGLPHPYLKARNDDIHLMPPAEFETLARSLGISNDTPVIVYDDNASLHAARAWWVFEHFGHRDVRVVNGGFNAWLDEGRSLTSVIPRPTPGSFMAQMDASASCDIEQVRTAARTQLWDARSSAEWTGQDARDNRRAGHVPGARNLEWRQLVEGPPQRRILAPELLRARLHGAGIDPGADTITYCQHGIRAAFAAFVLRLLGNDRVRVYDGSMAEWASREDTPLERA